MTSKLNIFEKIVVFFIIFSIMGALQHNYVKAEDPCDTKGSETGVIAECVYSDVKGSVATPQDIRRSAMNIVASTGTDAPMYISTGKGLDQTLACMAIVAPTLMPSPTPELEKVMETLDPEDCATFSTNPIAVAAGVEDPTSLYTYSSSSGSLAGLVLRGAGIVYNDTMPVNLAYYARDVASRIPFLKNTAFAQGIETGYFPGFDLILKLWKVTRNAAFGAVAIFMVVTGIMIMMRKQLNPRTAITVQNALPRLVIALALITFSYTIGALAVGLIGPLTSVALEPIRMASETFGTHGPLVTFLVIMWRTSGGVDVTFFTIILYTLAFFVLIVVFAMTIFRLFMVYVDLLLLVLMAPFHFAWGAIPGNEDTTMNWFKSVAANVLAIPAVTAGMSLGLYFAWKSLADLDVQSRAAGVAGPLASSWLSAGTPGWSTILVPMIVIVIFLVASKLPNELKKVLMK